MDDLRTDGDVDGYGDRLTTLVLAGVVAGVLVIGLGGRLAMLALRLSSGRRVHGITSDDGFTIGEVTLAGTYNLCQLGAALGLVGAAVYAMVAPWLLGPRWFRHLTCALGSGAVVGSMLVHADGVDFTMLGPTWFAIGLFVALPALFGASIGRVVDAARRGARWTRSGPRRRRLVPVLVVAPVPAAAFVVALIALGLALHEPRRRALAAHRAHRTGRAARLMIRTCWLCVALAGAVALVGDIGRLT